LSWLRGLGCAALFCLAASSAQAIVVVEQAVDAEHEAGWHGTLDGSVDERRGDTQRQTIAIEGQLAWRHARRLELAVIEGTQGASRGVRDLDRRFLHLRHRHEWNERWAGELFAQYERDPFAQLNRRRLWGGGVRISWGDEGNRWHLGLGAFDEEERYRTAPLRKHLLRGNLYLLLHQRWGDRSRLDAVLYLQPALRRVADRRVLFRAQFGAELSAHWRVQLGWEWTYASDPPRGAHRTNARLKTSIQLAF